MEDNEVRIVLASKSPRRSDILKNIGLRFDIVDNNFDESYDITMVPEDVVKYLAYNKALHASSNITDDALVISADTVVVLDGIILGKPRSEADAFNMLRSLSGKQHSVVSGLCVMETLSRKYSCDYAVTKVVFKELTDDEILSYIKSGEPLDKAGAYGIQGIGSLIVERIEGDYFNVVGLPVFKLSCMLKDFGLNLLML